MNLTKRTPFRGDLGKRIELDGNADEKRAIFRGDLGKRTPFRADLGKRVPFTVDLGKPAHLGKQNAFREDRSQFNGEPRKFRVNLGKQTTARGERRKVGSHTLFRSRNFRQDLG